MKKIIATLVLFTSFLGAAQAQTFYVGGVLMGTVCRAGGLWTQYFDAYQPVGSRCPIKNDYGQVVAIGVVTDE